MDRLKKESIDIHGIPVDNLFAEGGVMFKHFFKLRNCEFQYADFGQRDGYQRQLDFEIYRVISGHDSSGAMKTDDFTPAALMICKIDSRSGDKVMDMLAGLSGTPQIIPFMKGLFHMGL